MAEDLRFDDPEFPFGYFLVAGPGGYMRTPAKPMPPMHYALATDYTVDDMQAKLL